MHFQSILALLIEKYEPSYSNVEEASMADHVIVSQVGFLTQSF